MEWKDELKDVPKCDDHLILFLKHCRYDHWSYCAEGSYHNGKFYAKGGYTSEYKVTHWDYLTHPNQKAKIGF